MAAHEVIHPSPVKAIFADVQAEPKEVYKWLDQLEKLIAQSPRPFPVERVTKGNLKETVTTLTKAKTRKGYYVRSAIPAFIANKNGTRGITPRQCTYDFKILPLDRASRLTVPREEYLAWRRKHKAALSALSQAKKKKEPRPMEAWVECQEDPLVVQWIGISTDEATRMKPSRNPWSVHRWPLIEMGIDRKGCKKWMADHGYPEPPRSSCIFCPYHSNDHWLKMQQETPEEFLEAVEIEKTYQKLKAKTTLMGTPYLHNSLQPLDTIDFKALVEAKKKQGTQMDFGFGNECEGMCGV
jgi:hypothetical protein